MTALRPCLILAAAAGVLAVMASSDADRPAPRPQAAAIIVPEIGAPVALDRVHLVERPGLYGISGPAPGMQYAVIGSSLVRIDTGEKVIRSVIRGGVRPID